MERYDGVETDSYTTSYRYLLWDVGGGFSTIWAVQMTQVGSNVWQLPSCAPWNNPHSVMASDSIKDDNQVGSTAYHSFPWWHLQKHIYNAHPQHWTQLLAKMAENCRIACVLCRSPLPCDCYLCEAFINASLLKSQSRVPCWALVGYFIPSYRYFHYFPFFPYHYMQKSIISTFGLCMPNKWNQKKMLTRLQLCKTKP